MAVTTTFQKELEKIFGNDAVFDNTRYTGRACIGSLAPDIRAKAEFITGMVSNHYEAIRIKIINRHEGEIDSQVIRFKELWGNKPVAGNPNFPNGISPHMWLNDAKLEWYAYHPNKEDFDILRDEILGYTDMFRDMDMDIDQSGIQMG